MRCPQLIGRDDEVARLRRGFEAARAGHGSWTTVVGEPGIGKTRLVREVAGAVEAGGGRAVAGRCSVVDRTTPFRVLAEAVAGAARTVARPQDPSLQPYLPAVGRFVPHWRSGQDDQEPANESPAVVGESLVRVLAWLAGDRGLLVVLEDLHWADPDTVAVCDYLVDHLDGTAVSVVATARDADTPGPTMDVLRRAGIVRLEPLSAGEVARVAAACLGGAVPAATLDRLHDLAAGLPLLVEDLLDAPGGSRFDELVRARVDALSDAGRQTVVAAALVGERFGGRQVTGARGAGTLQEAVSAQLVVADGAGFRFRHALTRDAVLAAAPALASSLTAEVAQALLASGAGEDLARAAELWEAAGDPGLSAVLLHRAATLADQRGAPAAAGDLLARAVAVAPAGPARHQIALARLDHLVAHGHVDDALAVGAELLDAATDDLPRVHRALARTLIEAGRVDAAGPHLDAVTDGAERLVLRARAALAARAADRRVAAEHLAHQAVAAAETEGRHGLACEALEVVARCARSRSLADAESALRRALALADGWEVPAAQRLRILNELGTVEMLRAADGSRLARAHDHALRAGALDVAVGIQVNIAALHAMRNELDEARAVAERAEADARRLGILPLAAAALVMVAITDGFRGRRDAMERRLREAEDLSPADADLNAFAWGAGRGLCALVREERDEAVAAFRRAILPDPPVGTLDTARAPLLLIRAASGVATADDLAAARATATPGAGWSDLWLGYGEAAFTGDDAALPAADAAARRHPLFRAIGLRLLAEAATRDGWGDPVLWLQEAEAVFVAGGQDRIAAACRSLLKQAGAPATRRRGADRALPADLLRAGVTAREAEVLALLAERLGNREIATRLFLSPRTVEKHVASLLLKLGAPDRAGLAARARAYDGGAPSV